MMKEDIDHITFKEIKVFIINRRKYHHVALLEHREAIIIVECRRSFTRQ